MTVSELRALTANPEVFACSDVVFGLVQEDGTIRPLKFYGWRSNPAQKGDGGKPSQGAKPELILAYES